MNAIAWTPGRRRLPWKPLIGAGLALALATALHGYASDAARSVTLFSWTYYNGFKERELAKLPYKVSQKALLERASYLAAAGPVSFDMTWGGPADSVRSLGTDRGSMPMTPLFDPERRSPHKYATRPLYTPDGSMVVALSTDGGGGCVLPINWLSAYTRSRISAVWVPEMPAIQSEIARTLRNAEWSKPGASVSQCPGAEHWGTLLVRFGQP